MQERCGDRHGGLVSSRRRRCGKAVPCSSMSGSACRVTSQTIACTRAPERSGTTSKGGQSEKSPNVDPRLQGLRIGTETQRDAPGHNTSLAAFRIPGTLFFSVFHPVKSVTSFLPRFIVPVPEGSLSSDSGPALSCRRSISGTEERPLNLAVQRLLRASSPRGPCSRSNAGGEVNPSAEARIEKAATSRQRVRPIAAQDSGPPAGMRLLGDLIHPKF